MMCQGVNMEGLEAYGLPSIFFQNYWVISLQAQNTCGLGYTKTRSR